MGCLTSSIAHSDRVTVDRLTRHFPLSVCCLVPACTHTLHTPAPTTPPVVNRHAFADTIGGLCMTVTIGIKHVFWACPAGTFMTVNFYMYLTLQGCYSLPLFDPSHKDRQTPPYHPSAFPPLCLMPRTHTHALCAACLCTSSHVCSISPSSSGHWFLHGMGVVCNMVVGWTRSRWRVVGSGSRHGLGSYCVGTWGIFRFAWTRQTDMGQDGVAWLDMAVGRARQRQAHGGLSYLRYLSSVSVLTEEEKAGSA